jgi:hypothetical protein
MNTYEPIISLNIVFDRVPLDIFKYILEFIDITTPSVQAIRQNKKKQVNGSIKKAFSRNNNNVYGLGFDAEDEHWVFGFTFGSGESLQLQACNCKKCGNYSYPLGFDVQQHIMCSCDNNTEDW